MTEGQTYQEIVWRQFKKNRLAYWSLWLLVPVCLIAIFAPAIASDQPLIFRRDDLTIYPWFHSLFHPGQVVDFIFNMAMLGFIPWAVLAITTNYWTKRRGVKGSGRVTWITVEFVVVVALLTGFFGLPLVLGENGITPKNSYTESDFSQPDEVVYPPIPYGPIESNTEIISQPPNFRQTTNLQSPRQEFIHLLGTETLGRDVLVQLIYGTRLALTVGFVAVGIYITIGIVLGALAGFFGGWGDGLISRVIEVVMVFPAFFLILTFVALLGPSIFIIMGVIGLTGWPGIARLTRGEVLKQRSLDYTTAAQALGTSNLRIIFRHILPNALGPALVAIPFGVASAIITEAGLSLLGFGVQPPAPSWGTLLKLANENYANWWLVFYPSLAIFFTVTVFNLIGSGLRDAMDPRLRI